MCIQERGGCSRAPSCAVLAGVWVTGRAGLLKQHRKKHSVCFPGRVFVCVLFFWEEVLGQQPV